MSVTSPPHPTAPPAPAGRPGRRWVRVLLVAGCAAMAVMWGYVVYRIAFDQPKGAYRLDDTSWRVAAREICADARLELEGLASTEGGFIEEPTVEQMQARAAIVEQATDILETMVADLMAVPVDSDRDRAILEVFEEHYLMVIADRRRYAASLAAGENVRYTETVVKEAGGPVSNVVTDFTAGVKSNDVPECSPPNDLINTKAP